MLGPQEISLEKRVIDFLETRPEAENIDKLHLTSEQHAAEKADFFLSRRQVVCEVKSLQTDTQEKIIRLLQPILDSEEAPIFYGEWKLDNILKNLPNGEVIKREVFDVVTSAIQALFRKANRQIRTTKQMFSLPSAGGALVIVNDLVHVLSPEVIAHKLGELFRKRHPSGALQFPDIEAVWVISETHFVEVSMGMKAFPAMLLARNGPNSTTAILEGLQPAWAAKHGVPLVDIDSTLFDTIRFQKQESEDLSGKPIARYELWQQQYHTRPYLRTLDENQLGEHFKQIMAGITPGLLKGATEEEKMRSMQLMERFTHFLEEVKERGIDLKRYGPLMQQLGMEFKDGKTPSVDLEKIEAITQTKNQFVSGGFYTNALGKNYRCVKIINETATLILFDMFMGKSLEVIVRVNEPKWHYYWPITDSALLTALESRFKRFSMRHPKYC